MRALMIRTRPPPNLPLACLAAHGWACMPSYPHCIRKGLLHSRIQWRHVGMAVFCGLLRAGLRYKRPVIPLTSANPRPSPTIVLRPFPGPFLSFPSLRSLLEVSRPPAASRRGRRG